MPENKTLEDRLSRIEQTLEAFAKRFAVIERMLGAEGSTRATETALEAALKKRIAELERDRLALAERVSALEAGRLQARPEQVSDGFRKAIIALQAGLEPRPGDRVAYAVTELQVGLKSLVALDEKGELRFVLPAPDERFDPGQLTEVKFTLRSASELAAAVSGLVAVPSLLGLPLAAAEQALARAGLKPGRRAEQESRYAPGTVIGQSPDPGDEVPPDVPIDLVLAVPICPTDPDLRGRTLEEATALIAASGLTQGAVTRRPTRDEADGAVLAQDPPAGARVAPGAAVSLVVAIAPPPSVLVPDLVGRSRAEAELLLRQAELGIGEVSEKPAGRPDRVLAQMPKPGTEVSPGSTVSLVVSASLPVEVLIERAVKAAAGTRAGISGKLLGERLRALNLRDHEAFAALAESPLETLQKAIGAPTPRGLADAQAALRKALDGES